MGQRKQKSSNGRRTAVLLSLAAFVCTLVLFSRLQVHPRRVSWGRLYPGGPQTHPAGSLSLSQSMRGEGIFESQTKSQTKSPSVNEAAESAYATHVVRSSSHDKQDPAPNDGHGMTDPPAERGNERNKRNATKIQGASRPTILAGRSSANPANEDSPRGSRMPPSTLSEKHRVEHQPRQQRSVPVWRDYGELQGPRDVCGLSHGAIVAAMNKTHSCQSQVWQGGAWRHWEEISREADSSSAKTICLVTCTGHLPCPSGRCLWPFRVRPGTSDVNVVHQLFGEGHVSIRGGLSQPGQARGAVRSVLDAGANIGCSTVYLALRFPEALVVALEPSGASFELLLRNTAAFPNVVAVNKALWSRDTVLCIPRHRTWDAWGVKVEECTGQEGGDQGSSSAVHATSIPSLLRENHLPSFDILKIDIEGSEGEVFRSRINTGFLNASWFLMIELHGGHRSANVMERMFENPRWRFQGSHFEYHTWLAS